MSSEDFYDVVMHHTSASNLAASSHHSAVGELHSMERNRHTSLAKSSSGRTANFHQGKADIHDDAAMNSYKDSTIKTGKKAGSFKYDYPEISDMN